MSCGAFICSGNACKPSCATADDCAAGAAADYCEGGQCFAKLADKASCTHKFECQGGCCCDSLTPHYCSTVAYCSIRGTCVP